jgi:glycosyltransferase involved in cell wall biosynthesis
MLSGVSFIIPVHNEADILVDNCLYLLKLLKKLEVPFEIIIGSNGSTDKTDALGNGLAKQFQQLRFFSLPKKGIVGQVFKNAVKMAQYEKLISLDIDLTIDLSFINDAIKLLDVYDAAIGSKKAGKESRPWMRRLGSDTYLWVVKNFLRLGFSDYSIGAKAYRRSAILPHLNKIDARTGYVLTLIYYLYKNRKHIAQIPVNCNDHRECKFSLVNEGFYRFLHLFDLWLRMVLVHKHE